MRSLSFQHIQQMNIFSIKDYCNNLLTFGYIYSNLLSICLDRFFKFKDSTQSLISYLELNLKLEVFSISHKTVLLFNMKPRTSRKIINLLFGLTQIFFIHYPATPSP